MLSSRHRYISLNYSHIKDVERELMGLQLQVGMERWAVLQPGSLGSS